MTETKRIIGHDQDYPGSYRWPIYEILCPDCGKWSKEYGSADALVDGEWLPICEACAAELEVAS